MYKVLVISTVPFGINGITNVIKNHYNYIDKKKFRIDFVFNNKPNNGFIEQTQNNNSKVYILPKRSKQLLRYMKKLNDIQKGNNYDIVHIHGNSKTLAIEELISKKNNIKTIIPHAHNTFTKYPMVDKILEPIFEKNYSVGFSCSTDAGKWLFGDKKFYLIENGIDIFHYRFNMKFRSDIRKEFGYTEDEIVIGNIGRLSAEKNQKYLIELMEDLLRKNKNYRLLIVGEGQLLTEYKKMTEELNLNNYVRFSANRNDINKVLMGLDLFISSSYNEGLPLVLVEAQATDLKCLVSRNVSADVDITNTIDFFDLEDKDSLITLIEESIIDKKTRENHVMNKYLEESNYNIQNTLKKVEDIYSNSIEGEKNEFTIS